MWTSVGIVLCYICASTKQIICFVLDLFCARQFFEQLAQIFLTCLKLRGKNWTEKITMNLTKIWFLNGDLCLKTIDLCLKFDPKHLFCARFVLCWRKIFQHKWICAKLFKSSTMTTLLTTEKVHEIERLGSKNKPLIPDFPHSCKST